MKNIFVFLTLVSISVFLTGCSKKAPMTDQEIFDKIEYCAENGYGVNAYAKGEDKRVYYMQCDPFDPIDREREANVTDDVKDGEEVFV